MDGPVQVLLAAKTVILGHSVLLLANSPSEYGSVQRDAAGANWAGVAIEINWRRSRDGNTNQAGIQSGECRPSGRTGQNSDSATTDPHSVIRQAHPGLYV